jgi:hypothetical protein
MQLELDIWEAKRLREILRANTAASGKLAIESRDQHMHTQGYFADKTAQSKALWRKVNQLILAYQKELNQPIAPYWTLARALESIKIDQADGGDKPVE